MKNQSKMSCILWGRKKTIIQTKWLMINEIILNKTFKCIRAHGSRHLEKWTQTMTDQKRNWSHSIGLTTKSMKSRNLSKLFR